MVKLTDAHDFWNVIVVPDVGEYIADQTDLRKALHVAIALYQMMDWGVKSGWWKEDNTPFYVRCPEFRLIRDVCNALKHMRLTRKSTGVTGAENVQQTGIFDEGIFDKGIFDTARIVVDSGAKGVHDFTQLVLAVEKMWKEVLTEKGKL